MTTTIREYWQVLICWLTTNHAQADGSAFCKCCWRMFPLNETTREVFWQPRKG